MKSEVEIADAQHIILVDGKKLTELMMEYNLGVFTQKVYTIKKLIRIIFWMTDIHILFNSTM